MRPLLGRYQWASASGRQGSLARLAPLVHHRFKRAAASLRDARTRDGDVRDLLSDEVFGLRAMRHAWRFAHNMSVAQWTAALQVNERKAKHWLFTRAPLEEDASVLTIRPREDLSSLRAIRTLFDMPDLPREEASK